MVVAQASTGKILLIDREPGMIQVITSSLQASQYDVLLTHHLEEAIAAISNQKPDLVLLDDIGLSPADCSRFCQHIKTNGSITGDSKPSPLLPVVLMAEQASCWENPQESISAGVDDLIFKPIKLPELLSRINFLIRIRRERLALLQELDTTKQELARVMKDYKPLLLLKESMVSNISHELRTPLLQVKSAVALLYESTRSVNNHKDDPVKLMAYANEATKLVDYMTVATARLESIVSNISQLATSLNVKREPFLIMDAINTAIRQLSRRWESSGNVARIKVMIDDNPLVLGDRNGIGQVLQQLLDNAIKFSPGGQPVLITAMPGNDGLWIAVTDYGIGIADNQLEQIFQAFYQIDGSATRTFGGAGVGLAIVRLILDALGAPVDVKSTLGVGSTFSFWLPLATLD